MSNKSKANQRARRRAEFAGNRQRHPISMAGITREPLQFGPHGELTPRTIKQANLTPAEEARAFEMLEAQAAFLSIMDNLTYVVGPDGTLHDLSALGPTKDAIAWTLALLGLRQTGKVYIRKGAVKGYEGTGVHTWVDARTGKEFHPDNVERRGQEDDPPDADAPPETKRVQSPRAVTEPVKMPDGFKVKPKVVWLDEPRPDPLPNQIHKAQEFLEGGDGQ